VNKNDEGKLPGWTLLVNIASPVMATMILESCRNFGLSWAIGIPAAVVVVVGGLLWDTSIDRKYIRPQRRK
jgi:hypothetical protein